MEKQDTCKKRNRSPNFSHEEKVLLLNLINKFKHIVENKKTDAILWHEKQNAWHKITSEFNATTLTKRSVDCIKGFFENQKRNVHKKAAVEKKAIRATGGGGYTIINDPLFDVTMDIINKKTVYGLQNSYDGDGFQAYEDEPGDTSIQNSENILIEIVADEKDDESVNVQDKGSIGDVNNDSQPLQDTRNWSHYTPAMLKEPVNEKLRQSKGTSSEQKWCQRRRPSLSATSSVAKKYEDVADLKKQESQLHISILKTYEEMQKNIMEEALSRIQAEKKREAELYEIRLKKENLEVKIREAQLKLLNEKM